MEALGPLEPALGLVEGEGIAQLRLDAVAFAQGREARGDELDGEEELVHGHLGREREAAWRGGHLVVHPAAAPPGPAQSEDRGHSKRAQRHFDAESKVSDQPHPPRLAVRPAFTTWDETSIG